MDLTNVFKADVANTVGPYLAIYLLADRHWDLAKIGIAMAAQGIAVVLAQTPAGALVDHLRQKRILVAIACAAVAAGCLAITHADSLTAVIGAQVSIGIALVVISPAVAALTLGLVGRSAFASRMGRNEALSHGGAVVACIISGLLGSYVAYSGIFYFGAVASVLTGCATLLIRERDIDYVLAREARSDSSQFAPATPFRELLADRRIVIFALAVVMFHFANAAMLPLAGEMLSSTNPSYAPLFMSACIIVAQCVMTPVAVAAGRLATRWGRKPVFLIAFAVLPVRGLLFMLNGNPYYVISIQLLDGISAGIFGVVWVIVTADLARGTGRFNLLQGAINTCVAIGASLSNLMTGFVVKWAGYDTGFLTLAVLALLAFGFFWAVMPETVPDYSITSPDCGPIIGITSAMRNDLPPS